MGKTREKDKEEVSKKRSERDKEVKIRKERKQKEELKRSGNKNLFGD